MLGFFKREEKIITKDVFPSAITVVPPPPVKTASVRFNDIPVLTEVYKESPRANAFKSASIKINGKELEPVDHKPGFYCNFCAKILSLPHPADMVSKVKDGDFFKAQSKCECCNDVQVNYFYSFIKRK